MLRTQHSRMRRKVKRVVLTLEGPHKRGRGSNSSSERGAVDFSGMQLADMGNSLWGKRRLLRSWFGEKDRKEKSAVQKG